MVHDFYVLRVERILSRLSAHGCGWSSCSLVLYKVLFNLNNNLSNNLTFYVNFNANFNFVEIKDVCTWP